MPMILRYKYFIMLYSNFYTTLGALSTRQPPLQFYLEAISIQPWSKISVITYATNKNLLNPTFVALMDMNTRGQLRPNITMYQVTSYSTKCFH